MPRARWLAKMRVFGIVRMRAAGHAGHTDAKAGIAEALQSNFGGVVADNGVIADQLEKIAAAFRRGRELRFVGEFLKQAVLLFGRAVHEVVPELGAAARVHPLKSGEKSVLRFVSGLDGVVGRANVARGAYRHAVGDHEVDELGDASLFGSRGFIFGDDHLGEMLDHPVLLRRKEQRFVRGRWDVRR